MVFPYIFEGQRGIFCVINVWLNNLVDFMARIYSYSRFDLIFCVGKLMGSRNDVTWLAN